ncbi:MAG: hypothetical protein H0V30_03315 [Chitinophagaceae bacterium]|nr:hypothetical protein [Chitinophagaceae bacterium]
MKKCFLFIIPALFLFITCKTDNNESEQYFPVISFLNSQVAHVDTSVYAIKRITIRDSLSDTVFIPREEFRQLANDFLQAPDLTQKKFREKYTESEYYDDMLQKIIITYIPIEKDQELQRQEIHITPNTGDGDKISTIILNRYQANKDSTIQRRLLWQVDERFQVVTTIQKPGIPEETTTMKVIWNN